MVDQRNSFQAWAFKASEERGFEARTRGNWVEINVGGQWREYMSVSGVCDAIGALDGTGLEGLYR